MISMRFIQKDHIVGELSLKNTDNDDKGLQMHS